MKKYIICITILIMIILLMVWLIIEKYEDTKIPIKEQKIDNIEERTEDNTIIVSKQNTNKLKEYQKEKIIQEYKGYDVCAKLEIPSINLETYVLKNYSVQALNISVTKFWGANPNQIGNFCIAGHNFKNINMFSNLKKLEIGEKIYITDNDIGKVEYTVYNIEKVTPENVECLNQDTTGRKVTLITCTSDSLLRIIVQAKENL